MCYGLATSALSPSIPECPALAPANNGNIWEIANILNINNSQSFGYDTLNRLTSFRNSANTVAQSYSIDPFGNMAQAGTLTFSTAFDTNNRMVGSGVGYDATGNVTQFNDGVVTNTYVYNAENKLVSVNGAATYTYDANGDRSRKDANGGWSEYVHFNGQPVAERTNLGGWSNYIFANGQRIARIDNYDIRIHMSGTNCSSYRRSYVAKRQEFFCNIQHTYELWRYFRMFDWNFQNELGHMGRLGGQESATPLALFSKAHAKIRIAIELAFARCTEEARPIMRDAIRLAVCAHRLRVDAKLEQIWRSKGNSVAADASFNRTFGRPKKTTLFKGLPRLYARWMQLGEVIAHVAPRPQTSNDDGNCKPVIFDCSRTRH